MAIWVGRLPRRTLRNCRLPLGKEKHESLVTNRNPLLVTAFSWFGIWPSSGLPYSAVGGGTSLIPPTHLVSFLHLSFLRVFLCGYSTAFRSSSSFFSSSIATCSLHFNAVLLLELELLSVLLPLSSSRTLGPWLLPPSGLRWRLQVLRLSPPS